MSFKVLNEKQINKISSNFIIHTYTQYIQRKLFKKKVFL